MSQAKAKSFEVGTDGVIRTIYSDDLNDFTKKLNGEISTVCRASQVEWEQVGEQKGWTVRAQHNPRMALREKITEDKWVAEIVCSDDSTINPFVFSSREDALKMEVEFFFQLLPPKHERGT